MPASARSLMRTPHSTLCRISGRPSPACGRLALCRSGKMSGCGAIRSSKSRKSCTRARGRGPMTERALIGQPAREFCDDLWQRGDFWAFESSEYERARGGRLLLANTVCEVEDMLLLTYLIRNYRDLFLNVGFRLDAEEIFRGAKNGVDFEILISLFVKAPAAAGGDG